MRCQCAVLMFSWVPIIFIISVSRCLGHSSLFCIPQGCRWLGGGNVHSLIHYSYFYLPDQNLCKIKLYLFEYNIVVVFITLTTVDNTSKGHHITKIKSPKTCANCKCCYLFILLINSVAMATVLLLGDCRDHRLYIKLDDMRIFKGETKACQLPPGGWLNYRS